MSLPHLLLVDDSDAILNFEKAVLSGLYRFSTASDGQEALEKIRQIKPDGVLLDLSMPKLDGDEVLKIIKADPAYSHIPFLVISSEKERAEACLRTGAEGVLNKPIIVDELKARVALMLEAAQARERKKNSAFLFCGVGPFQIGLPLQPVASVHSQPATRRKKDPSTYFMEEVDIYGEAVPVLDCAQLLGVKHGKPLEDRKLLVLQGEEKIALCVDSVWDPEELSVDQLHGVEAKKGDKTPLTDYIHSLVDSSHGLLPVVQPGIFFSENLLPHLAGILSPYWGKKPSPLTAPRP